MTINIRLWYNISFSCLTLAARLVLAIKRKNSHSNVISVLKLDENGVFHLILDLLCQKVKFQDGR